MRATTPGATKIPDPSGTKLDHTAEINHTCRAAVIFLEAMLLELPLPLSSIGRVDIK